MKTLVVAFFLLLVFLSLHAPGLDSLDARLSYSPLEAYYYISLLGAAGRRAYLVHEMVDLGFIAVYSNLIRRIIGERLGPKLLFWCLLPAAADLVETGSILFVLLTFPSEPAALYPLMARMTTLKWLSTSFTLLCLFYALLFRRKS